MISPTIEFSRTDWGDLVRDGVAPGRPLAVSELQLKWGRDDYLDEHKPATAYVTFLVFEDARRVTDILLRYSHSMMVTISAGGLTLFRGHVREAKASRAVRNGTPEYRFEVTAVDVTFRLSHHRPLTSGWAAGDASAAKGQVLKRIKQLGMSSEISDMDLPAASKNFAVQYAHDDWAQSTLRTYIERLYRSYKGVGWDYDMNAGKIIPQRSAAPFILPGLVHYKDGLHVQAEVDNLNKSFDTTGLNGDELGVDDIGFLITPRQSLRTVKVSAYGYSQSEKIEKEITVNELGNDSTTLDTMLAPARANDTRYLDQLAKGYANFFFEATKWPAPPSIRYEFEDLEDESAKRYWLCPWQTGVVGLLRNSQVLDWLRFSAGNAWDYPPPTVIPYAGTISFDGQRWRVLQDLIIFGNPDAPRKPVTYSTLNDGGYKLKDYAPATFWGEFAILPPNNSFKETVR